MRHLRKGYKNMNKQTTDHLKLFYGDKILYNGSVIRDKNIDSILDSAEKESDEIPGSILTNPLCLTYRQIEAIRLWWKRLFSRRGRDED